MSPGGPLSRPESKLNLGVKGSQDAGTGTGPEIGPPVSKVGPDNSFNGLGKFEPVDFAAVRGGAGQVENTKHGAHGKGSGGPQPSAQAGMRGHADASGLFEAQKGHAPKRSAGNKTPTDMDTRRKLSTAEGG